MKNVYVFPMNPAQSWAFLLFLFVGVALFTMFIHYGVTVASVAPANYAIAGPRGILYAIAGQELSVVRREHVIDMSRRFAGGYCATTTDGEQTYKYVVIPSREDEENGAYLDAVNLAGDNPQLRATLMPDSRVKKHMTLCRDDEEIEVFVVYIKYDSVDEIVFALDKFFQEEYEHELG